VSQESGVSVVKITGASRRLARLLARTNLAASEFRQRRRSDFFRQTNFDHLGMGDGCYHPTAWWPRDNRAMNWQWHKHSTGAR
jgi:hypothetical protein